MSKYKTILVSNEDFVYGVEKKHYPEILELKEQGSIDVCTKEDVKEKYASTVDSLNNEDAIYILNPYTNTCTPLDNPDLEQKMIIDEGIAVREALVALGAKHIFIKEEVEDKKEENGKVKVGGGTPIYEGELSSEGTKAIRLNLKKILESKDDGREPESIEICYKRIYESGLSNNPNLTSLFKRLKDSKDKRLFGTEKISIEYDKELSRSLDVALKLSKLEVFNANIGGSYKSKALHSFKYEVSADFGPHTPKEVSSNIIDE